MARSPRVSSRLGFESSDSFVEERSKTFVLPRRTESSADGASELDFSTISDMDTIVSLVNNRFDRKEKQIKSEMREEFERRLHRDNMHHEEVIATLKRDLSHLTKISHECDGLKEAQKSLQQTVTTQNEKILILREENTQLRSETAKIPAMSDEIEALKSENEILKREKNLTDVKSMKLKSTVSEKEREIASLKFLIDTQYKRIKLDLTNTRDKFYNEQEGLQKDMRQQHVMLQEISDAVKNLSGDATDVKIRPGQRVVPPAKDRRSTVVKIKPFIGGKTSTTSSFNKLTVDDLATSSPTKKKTLSDNKQHKGT